MNILLVDDDPSVIDTVSMILEDHGCSVTRATHGEECIRAIEAGFSGLVLLDVMMPKLNGWQTVERLIERQLIHRVLICMMTCVTDPDLEASKVSQYIHGYIEKPFKSVDLVEYVSQYKDLLPR